MTAASIPRQAAGGRVLADYRDAHRGEAILVCGCGESLNLLEHPERVVTIGVNDVGRRFTPDYLVVVNPRSQFTGDRFRWVESSGARALFSQLALGVAHPNVVRFRLGRYGGTNDAGSDTLHFTRNSPYVAVCLALHMGARRIGLIGVDFTEHHFFAPTGVHALARRLEQIDDEYRALGESCRARGVELVNLGPASRLTSLPRASLDEFAAPAAPALHVVAPPPPARVAPRPRRVFFVNYRFLACGDVFATGLSGAAETLGIEHAAAWWDDPALPAKIAAFAPHLVFVVHGRRFAQRWGATLAAWPSAVWLLDEPYEVDDTSRWSSRFGTVFVNDPATLPRHRNAHVLPVCFDPRIHRDAGLSREHQVGFIGGYNAVRESYLARLAHAGLLSYVVGGPWRSPVVQRLRISDRSTPAETAALYQRTSIVLNVYRSIHHFNRSGVIGTTLNPRIYEALACGALVVTERRPELAVTFPELPTFRDEDELETTVRALLADPARAARLLAASRDRLAGHDYATRLASALERALDEPAHSASRASHPATSATPVTPSNRTASLTCAPPAPPGGWALVGDGIDRDDDGTWMLKGDGAREIGIGTLEALGPVTLSFDVLLDPRCAFIAKIHQTARGDRNANSYHLVTAPRRGYLGRHHVALASVAVARERWQHVELSWSHGVLALAVDGREVCRCVDAVLETGVCFVGVTDGTARLRALRAESPVIPSATVSLSGWTVQGTGALVQAGDAFVLAANGGEAIGLVSDAAANDVELEVAVRLDAHAHLIAKLHQQERGDPDANSYHLVSTPAAGYLARHGQVLGSVRIGRGIWQRLRLRWVDQRLELFVNGRRSAIAGDSLLQGGHCAIGVSDGRVELRGLIMREVPPSPRSRVATRERTTTPAIAPVPFTGMPRRNLLYHVWPVRGEMWRWNVEQLRRRIDLFNGERIIGIVHDARSASPDDVRAMFDGHGCEFVVAPNGPLGEGLTFPAMLERVRSMDPNEVTFYGHAKGVKYEPSIPAPVKRWAEAQYRAGLDHWPSVRAQLERFAMTGSFKMLGRFRAHHHVGDWHYSGTYFWLRHSAVFARRVSQVDSFYGCVEAWPGVHFRREETGCLLLDGLRQLPYHEEFWRDTGDAAIARWEATHPAPLPPASLLAPSAFEGFTEPRLEQHASEFAWLVDALLALAPRSILCIGSMHGGVEWHLARRFRAEGRELRITAVDLDGRPELLATLADARATFGQDIELVVGDSSAETTRIRLAPRYDAVFVDGDHGYRGARADVELALSKTPRLLALHDIVDSEWHAQAGCCVSRVWSELRAAYATEERVVGDWGGIGIVRL